jgi:hypothetical protein
MARKVGLKVLRGKTIAVQLQITEAAHHRATSVAARRYVSVPTLLRVFVELALANEAFLVKLLDDDMVERNAADEALPAPKAKASHAMPFEPSSVPLPLATLRPLLDASVADHGMTGHAA